MGNLRSYFRNLSAGKVAEAVQSYEQKQLEKLGGDGPAAGSEGEDRLDEDGLPYASTVPDGVKYLAGLMHSTHKRVEQDGGEVPDSAEGDAPNDPDPSDQAEGRG